MPVARFMKERPFKVKTFTQTSLTIPGLGTTPEQVIEACRNGQAVRVHQSGSYDDDPSLDRISPFQRGFEITDMAGSPGELRAHLSALEEDIRKERLSRQSAQSAEPGGSAFVGEATANPEEPGEKKV